MEGHDANERSHLLDKDAEAAYRGPAVKEVPLSIAGAGKEDGSDTQTRAGFLQDTSFLFQHIPGLLLVVYLLCLLSSVLLFSYSCEGWSVVDSLYFGVVTLTTVGYGDMTPSTVPGEIGASVLSLAGVGVALGVLDQAIDSHFSKRAWFGRALGASGTVVVASTAVIARVEGWDWRTAAYYFWSTGTTLGYGDFSPQTALARGICVVYVPLLVVTFGLVIVNGVTDKFAESLDKDKRIEAWLDRTLTKEGFETLDVSRPVGKVSYDEFLVGMLLHCQEAFRKIPDRLLVQKLKSKFMEIDVSGTGYVTPDDREAYARRRRGEPTGTGPPGPGPLGLDALLRFYSLGCGGPVSRERFRAEVGEFRAISDELMERKIEDKFDDILSNARERRCATAEGIEAGDIEAYQTMQRERDHFFEESLLEREFQGLLKSQNLEYIVRLLVQQWNVKKEKGKESLVNNLSV